MPQHVLPQLLAVFRELFLACAAYVATYMLEILHIIKFIVMMIRCYKS
jgi:hypothetical protein